MLAFHSNPAIKAEYLARVHAHALADEIIKGTYWQDGRGCAVGCTVHSSNHLSYESELGIPEWLARLEDTIFEGLPLVEAKLWPERFLAAIKPGANLDKVKGPFLIYILESTFDTFDQEKFPAVKKAIDDAIALWRKYPLGAASAAEAMRVEAMRVEAEAMRAAAWAAEAAAWAAGAAAWAAEAAVMRAAAWAAEAVRAAAWAAAERYSKFADKLLELLKACEPEASE